MDSYEASQHWPQQPVSQPIYVRQAPTSGLAVAALVLGLVWCWGIGSILAVIFGHVAQRDIKRTGKGGGGMAVAGLVLGYIGIAGTVLITTMLVVLAESMPTSDYCTLYPEDC